jgi:hypothetical protein
MTENQKIQYSHNKQNVPNIYKYAEWYINSRLNLFTKLDSRIIATLGFSGVALKVIADMETTENISCFYCYTCIWLKAIALTCIGVAISILVLSLRFRLSSSSVSLKEAMDNTSWLGSEEIYWKMFIYKQWAKMDEEIEEKLTKKGKSLNISFTVLGISGIAFALNSIILIFSKL